MTEESPQDEIERIPSETWCTVCKREVAAWKVSYETTIHSEENNDDRIRRCPHCNARCFADRTFSVGCFLFFLGLFGSVLWLPVFDSLGIDMNVETGAGQFVYFNFMLANGVALYWLPRAIWKWRIDSTRKDSIRRTE